ncbi:MAG TPA: lysylphosphatidylglycerol synthase transmembrane domain-containing protein [Nitrospiria bacterium]|nr:lysylphosphatidylglycerol synthase transmembrane domain-containing protein [Nitrospiria bacterium]
MRIKQGLIGILRFSVALGILSLLFSKIPLSEILAAIHSAKINYLLAAFSLSLLTQVILAHRLRFLTDQQGMLFTSSEILEINLSSVFYGLFLPGGNLAAGAVRFFKLSKVDRKFSEAFVSLIFDRIIATITLCMLGVLFWLIESPLHTGYIGMGMILALGLSSTPYMLIFRRDPSHFWSKYFGSIKWPPVSKKVNRLFSSLNQYQKLSPNSLAYIFSLSITGQLLGILIFYLLAVSLGINISFVTIGWIRSAVLIISMVPISVSGLGIREGASLFLLMPYGVPGEKALALSFLIFATTLLLIGALGGFLEGRKQILSGAR